MNVPVTIIGCGPIGLTGALLLSQFGIKTLIIDKRGEVNTHPRSRFVDTNTMELMRQLGIEKEVEETGLGPEWTEYNRWFSALTKEIIAEIPSPTFHTVPRDTSPCLPVMTCQDYVENILLDKARHDTNIDMRFNTEATKLVQNDSGTALTFTHPDKGTQTVNALYTIGADGPHSLARTVIGSELESNPQPLYSQDVIFEADLSKQVEGRKGGLLYNATPSGILVFQPLNGVTRWRCQIFKPDDRLLTNDETIERIREAIGSEEEIPISITSTGMWQPTPGCTSKFREGRIFLAGDAAHVFTPAGGIGNNTGFTGIRNLAWKLAYVIKDISPVEILDSYEIEHKPLALRRIRVGVETASYMGQIFGAFYAGEDTGPGARATRQYADYDGVLLGYELESDLIAKNDLPAPAVDNETIDFIPAIRCGRRAPHVWCNEAEGQSVLDWFGTQYALILGSRVNEKRWRDTIEKICSRTSFPLAIHMLPETGLVPYSDTGAVLVRPDGYIAACWEDRAIEDSVMPTALAQILPLPEQRTVA